MNLQPMQGVWRFWLTRVVVVILLVMVIRVAVAILDGAELPLIFTRVLGCALGVVALLGLGRVGWLNPHLNGLMPKTPARGLLMGAVAGTLLYSFVVLVAALSGWYSIQSTSLDAASLLSSFALLVFAAAFEEILFRGILFQTLELALGTLWALLLSALLFGVLHLGNTHATGVGAFAVGLAGVALGAAFAWTRDLWLLTGVHVMWNFMQGPIFGVAVSGKAFKSWVNARIQGPDAFTGGAFGFEAGTITITLCLVLIFWLGRAAQRVGRWRGLKNA